jgi:hypothetical protein
VLYIDGAGLDRHGIPLYVELLLRSADEAKGAIYALFNEFIRPHDQVMDNIVQQFAKSNNRGRVFLPAERSHPYGWFFQSMGLSGKGSRPERWKALMVAFSGRVNPIPCRECLVVYERSVTSSGEHINTPFFDCTSRPPWFGGACAGCIYNARASQCSWAIFRGYQPSSNVPLTASHCFSGEVDDNTEKRFFAAPHPMAASRHIPGSHHYLSFDPAVQKRGNRAGQATEMGKRVKKVYKLD